MNFLKKKSNLRIINFCTLFFLLLLSQSESSLGQNVYSTKECQSLDKSTQDLMGIAQKITVRITSTKVDLGSSSEFVGGAGSGVLIKGNGVYYVITTQHFFTNDGTFDSDGKENKTPRPKEEAIEIPFQQDVLSLPIKFETVKKSPAQLDSILLKLSTQNPNWTAAEIQETGIANGEKLLVSGFPSDNPEQFKCIYSTFLNTAKPYIYYKPSGASKAERGMSGGSVINSEGKLIGIHAGTPDDKKNDVRGIPASVWLPIFSTQLSATKNSTQTPPTSAIPSNNNPKSEADGSNLPSVRALW